MREDLANIIEELMNMDEDNDLSMIIKLLGTEDETFQTLAPVVMDTYKQNLNKPDIRLALTQSFNAAGVRFEDLKAEFDQLINELNELDLSNAKKDFLKEFIGALIQAIGETEGIAKRIIPIAVELCHPDAKMPTYAHESDSGMDVYALDDYTIKPGETVLIPTGLKMAVPPGYEIQVRPKSGRCLKTKLRIANSPGTVDAGYRDEIGVIIDNIEAPIVDWSPTDVEDGRDFYISKGDKFCQLVLQEVPKAALFQVDNILEVDKDNRGGGFGSTGLK